MTDSEWRTEAESLETKVAEMEKECTCGGAIDGGVSANDLRDEINELETEMSKNAVQLTEKDMLLAKLTLGMNMYTPNTHLHLLL